MRKLSINELSAVDGQSANLSTITVAGFTVPFLTAKASSKLVEKAAIPVAAIFCGITLAANDDKNLVMKGAALAAITACALVSEDAIDATYDYMGWPKG